MSVTLTTFEAFEPIFDELWLAVGPKERADYAERARVYHKALRDLHAASIRVAVERYSARTQIRALPAPGQLRTLALEHATEMRQALEARAERELPAVPATHCPCRCGGHRWYRVLRDAQGVVRCFPPDLASHVQSGLPAAVAATLGGALAALTALAGEPMLRAHVTCKRNPRAVLDPAPRQGYVGLHADGCPVYDPDRRDARQEAAA